MKHFEVIIYPVFDGSWNVQNKRIAQSGLLCVFVDIWHNGRALLRLSSAAGQAFLGRAQPGNLWATRVLCFYVFGGSFISAWVTCLYLSVTTWAWDTLLEEHWGWRLEAGAHCSHQSDCSVLTDNSLFVDTVVLFWILFVVFFCCTNTSMVLCSAHCIFSAAESEGQWRSRPFCVQQTWVPAGPVLVLISTCCASTLQVCSC